MKLFNWAACINGDHILFWGETMAAIVKETPVGTWDWDSKVTNDCGNETGLVYAKREAKKSVKAWIKGGGGKVDEE